jgi:hypothetical protein
MKNFNPKALNLEKLRYTNKRVTLGFKCSPQLKLDLAKKAELRKITLSEYVEGLVVNLPQKSNEQRKEINELYESLNHYEDNQVLKNILTKEFGKEYKIITQDKKSLKIKINSVKDVFDVLVNSFKIQ